MFGLVDVTHTPALGVMEIVPNRTAATLLPIIQKSIAPGTTVHSDQWRAYQGVSSLANVAAHNTVNHSIQSVSPIGTHTQNVEAHEGVSCIRNTRILRRIHVA